jgi:hypothetical protein
LDDAEFALPTGDVAPRSIRCGNTGLLLSMQGVRPVCEVRWWGDKSKKASNEHGDDDGEMELEFVSACFHLALVVKPRQGAVRLVQAVIVVMHLVMCLVLRWWLFIRGHAFSFPCSLELVREREDDDDAFRIAIYAMPCRSPFLS